MSESTTKRYDFLWCVGLLVAGAGGLALSFNVAPFLAPRWPQWLLLPMLAIMSLGCSCAIGAGLGAPFRRKLFGAAAGVLLFAVYIMLLYLPDLGGLPNP